MKITNSDLVYRLMAEIDVIQGHVKAVEDAAHYVSQSGRKTVDYGNMRDLLIDAELRKWRELAMWGLTVTDAERDRIKAAAHDRFLAGRRDVSHWLSESGQRPSSYLVADDEAFRKMAARAFGPTTKD